MEYDVRIPISIPLAITITYAPYKILPSLMHGIYDK